MIHVVFQRSDAEVLAKAILLDESLQGKIITFNDDYAVGPLLNIHTPEGLQLRKDWWKMVFSVGSYYGSFEDVKDESTILELLDSTDNEEIWIWAAQNKHDVSGYYWLISQLPTLQGRVYILYLNNLPFINEKGQIFYPANLFEIQPKEFLKAKKLARIVTPSEFEVDSDEWMKICNENKGVRILDGGKKLIHYDYDHYDAELLRYITADWQKVSKVLQQFYSKSKNTTGDAYILWRIQILFANEQIDIQGKPGNMKEYEVKLKSGIPAYV